MLNAANIRRWLELAAQAMQKESTHLSELDQAIGDGDHGLNMARGFTKAVEKLNSLGADSDIATLLKTTGMTLLSSVGGASGPLYGTFFLKASQAAIDRESLDLAALAEVIHAGSDGLKNRGKANPGDKTLCDVWLPVSGLLEQAAADGLTLQEALQESVAAAVQAAKATVAMQARKGRASYLGERSIGHEDPGAASSVLLLKALAEAAA